MVYKGMLRSYLDSRPDNNDALYQEYQKIIDYANKLFLDCVFKNASQLYSKALDLVERLKRPEHEQLLIAVMLVASLSNSNEAEDLHHAFNTLQSVCDSETINTFPAVYYLTAKVFYSLYRFDEAFEIANEGHKYVTNDKKVLDYNMPSFKIPLKEMNRLQLMKSLLEMVTLCRNAPKPDGICNLENCQYMGQLHEIATKNIFIDDPFFEGMISMECSNRNSSALVQFHKECWMEKKKSLLLANVPVKDILDMSCFNCGRNNSCVITRIEIHDPNSIPKVYESYKKRQEPSSGAVKKQFLPSKDAGDEMNNFARMANDNSGGTVKNCDRGNYDDNDILMVLDSVTDPKFTGDSLEEVNEKKFIYSMFKDFISTRMSTVGQTRSFWKSCQDDFTYVKHGIINFLLNTNKFIVIDGQLCNQEVVGQIDLSHEDVLIDNVLREFIQSSDNKAANRSCDNKDYSHINTFDQAEANAISEEMKNQVWKKPDQSNTLSSNCTLNSKSCSTGGTEKLKKESVVKKETLTPYQFDGVPTLPKDSDWKKGLKLRDCEMAFFEKQIDDLKGKNQGSVKDYRLADDTTNLNELTQYCKHLEEENSIFKSRNTELIFENEQLKKKLMINEDLKQIKDEVKETLRQEYNSLLEEKCKENEIKCFEKIKALQETHDAKMLCLLKHCSRDLYSMNKKYLDTLLQNCNNTFDVLEETNLFTSRLFIGAQKLPKWSFWRTTLESKKSELKKDYQRVEKVLNEPLPKKFDDIVELLMKPVNLPLCEVENIKFFLAQNYHSIMMHAANMQPKFPGYYMSMNPYNQHYVQNTNYQNSERGVESLENGNNGK